MIHAITPKKSGASSSVRRLRAENKALKSKLERLEEKYDTALGVAFALGIMVVSAAVVAVYSWPVTQDVIAHILE
jgi:hypothetical protein